MEHAMDDTPLPVRKTLEDLIEEMEAGKSLPLFDYSLSSVRSTISRVKRRYPDRKYVSADTDQGPRAWRVG
jgi:hypothetical protein